MGHPKRKGEKRRSKGTTLNWISGLPLDEQPLLMAKYRDNLRWAENTDSEEEDDIPTSKLRKFY